MGIQEITSYIKMESGNQGNNQENATRVSIYDQKEPYVNKCKSCCKPGLQYSIDLDPWLSCLTAIS